MRLSEVLDFNDPNARYPYTTSYHGSTLAAEFNTENNQKIIALIVVYGKNMWDVSFARNGMYSLTGEGNQFKIFNTIFHFILMAIRTYYAPKYITFTANNKERGRVKFYNTIIRKLAPRYLPGFVSVSNSGLERIALPGRLKRSADSESGQLFILKNTKFTKPNN
jgi:hypothetical protein